MDERLLANLDDIAEGVGISTSEVIMSLCVDWFARQDAYMQSYDYVSRPLFEFSLNVDITAKYQMLKGIYDHKHQREWEQMTEHAAIHGHPLTDEQREWLDKQQEGHKERKKDLDDYNEMKMEMERGRIPADYEGAPGPALSWLAEFDRGEITAEQLAARWTEHARSAGWQSADDGEG